MQLIPLERLIHCGCYLIRKARECFFLTGFLLDLAGTLEPRGINRNGHEIVKLVTYVDQLYRYHIHFVLAVISATPPNICYDIHHNFICNNSMKFIPEEGWFSWPAEILFKINHLRQPCSIL